MTETVVRTADPAGWTPFMIFAGIFRAFSTWSLMAMAFHGGQQHGRETLLFLGFAVFCFGCEVMARRAARHER